MQWIVWGGRAPAPDYVLPDPATGKPGVYETRAEAFRAMLSILGGVDVGMKQLIAHAELRPAPAGLT